MKTQMNFKKWFALLALVILATSTASTAAQTAPAAPPAGGTFAQRLDQRKHERNIQLVDKDQKRLGQMCVGAQGIVRALQQKTGPIINNRIKTYQHIDAKLWIINGQLKLADKDTFELEKQRLKLTEKIADFQTTAANYQQAIDDILVINCQADVVGFKALVDTLRLYHVQLREKSNDIRSHVVDGIKPVLAGYTADLQPKTATEGGR